MNLANINGKYINTKYIDYLNIEIGTILELNGKIIHVIVSEYDDEGFNDENGEYHGWNEVKSISNMSHYLISKKHSWVGVRNIKIDDKG